MTPPYGMSMPHPAPGVEQKLTRDCTPARRSETKCLAVAIGCAGGGIIPPLFLVRSGQIRGFSAMA